MKNTYKIVFIMISLVYVFGVFGCEKTGTQISGGRDQYFLNSFEDEFEAAKDVYDAELLSIEEIKDNSPSYNRKFKIKLNVFTVYKGDQVISYNTEDVLDYVQDYIYNSSWEDLLEVGGRYLFMTGAEPGYDDYKIGYFNTYSVIKICENGSIEQFADIYADFPHIFAGDIPKDYDDIINRINVMRKRLEFSEDTSVETFYDAADIFDQSEKVFVAKLLDYENPRAVEEGVAKLTLEIENMFKGDYDSANVIEIALDNPNSLFNDYVGAEIGAKYIFMLGVDEAFYKIPWLLNRTSENLEQISRTNIYRVIRIEEDGGLKQLADYYSTVLEEMPESFENDTFYPKSYDQLIQNISTCMKYDMTRFYFETEHQKSILEAYDSFENVYMGDVINVLWYAHGGDYNGYYYPINNGKWLDKRVVDIGGDSKTLSLDGAILFYVVEVRVDEVYKGNYKPGDIIRTRALNYEYEPIWNDWNKENMIFIEN